MTSPLLLDEVRNRIESAILSFLNSQQDYVSATSVNSPRAVGDAIQERVAQNLLPILSSDVRNYTSVFERRAMADLAFEDVESNYYIVDVKTHRLSTKFNMPNLTSVERLARFYDDDRNYFVVLMVQYDIEVSRLSVRHVHFVPIEYLDWSCLTIGALGWGQIQIANANRIIIDSSQSRRTWMLNLCDTVLDFYPREIAKIEERIRRFQQIRDTWVSKNDG
ncbi:MAG: hypothetical protein UZ13_02671 [Chloroflexi bacterium OLB13]|nr:MAG: hypothetical protein UZ13_02671 [Chloroflexi bacterium OLB13]